MMQNITETLMKEIEKRKSQLSNKYKTLFIQSFNHEVRHPINSIQTIADLTIKDIQQNKEIQSNELLEN